jgi:hypothetical protein
VKTGNGERTVTNHARATTEGHVIKTPEVVSVGLGIKALNVQKVLAYFR